VRKKSTEEIVLDRGMPVNDEAERIILGVALRNSERFREIESSVKRTDFQIEKHRKIFAAMATVAEEQQPVHMSTVSHELIQRDDLEAIGGFGYLCDLDDFALGADHYPLDGMIAKLRKVTMSRRLISALDEAMQRCLLREDPELVAPDFVERLRSMVMEFDSKPEGTTVEEIIERAGGLGRFLSGGANTQVIRTPFDELNRITVGMRAGSLWIMAARPSCGKTTAAVQMAIHAARHGKRVAFFSFEMPPADLLRNAAASIAGVDSQDLHHGRVRPADLTKVNRAFGELAKLSIEYFSSIDNTPGRVRARLDAMVTKGPVDLVVIDYLGLMNSGRKAERKDLEIGEITRSLKLMAAEFGLPVLLLCQLSRDPEKRQGKEKRPKLTDLRDSGNIEQDGDVVVFLSRPDGEDKRRVLFDVAKQRLGPLGDFEMEFQMEYARFRDIRERAA
jgi:replicative DNA helicase